MVQNVCRYGFVSMLPAFVCVLGVGGCGGGETADPTARAVIHVDPPHWPNDLPDAVDRLERGQQAARQALTEGGPDDAREDPISIVRDLARWLPKVAAESDLPEPEWDRINAISGRLLTIYESLRRDLDRGRAVDPDRLGEAEGHLVALRRVVDEADPSWFAPLPARMRGPTDSPNPSDSDGEPTVTGDVPAGASGGETIAP